MSVAGDPGDAVKHDPFTGDDAQPAAGTRGDLPDPLERILPDDGAVAGRSTRGGQQQGAILALDPGQAPQQVSGGSRNAHAGLGGVESDIESDVDGDVVGARWPTGVPWGGHAATRIRPSARRA